MNVVSATFCYRCGWDRAYCGADFLGCSSSVMPITVDEFIVAAARRVAVDVLGLGSYEGMWNEHDIALVRALAELLNQSADLDENWAAQGLPF